MFNKIRFATAVSAFALICAPPALADITAAELWAAWQEQANAAGQTVTADSVSESDSGLSLSGVSSITETAAFRVVTNIGSIELNENGDGTVSMVMPEEYQIDIIFLDHTDDEPVIFQFLMHMEDADIVASGTADALRYDYSVGLLTITEGAIFDIPDQIDTDQTFILEGVLGDQSIDLSDPETLVFDINMGVNSIAGNVNLVSQDGSGVSLQSGMAMQDLQFAMAVSIDVETLNDDFPDFPENFSFEASYEHGPYTFGSNFDDGRESFLMSAAAASGDFGVIVSPEIFALETSIQSMTVNMMPPELPFPIALAFDEIGLDVSFPLAASPEPSEFAAGLSMLNFTIDDQLWMMMDPAQTFPRDPVTAILDLTGTVVVLADLLSPEAMALPAPPIEPRSLMLNELLLSAVGSEVTATGDLEFAPGSIIPFPVGRIEVGLHGANALLDRLEATGMFPIQQLVLARGMLGGFATPGSEPDSFTSVIEFTPGGGITANGVPLQ